MSDDGLLGRRVARALGDIDLLFDDSAAGIQISGDSGSGKSNVMQILMQSIIMRGIGLALIDPHGDLARAMIAYCAHLPPRLRRRVVVVHPANTQQIAGLNPLAISDTGSDAVFARAQLACKVGHVSRILLHAWGEENFNSKPVMAKWTTRYLTTLAHAKLTIPDVRLFFDVYHPIYRELCRATPDVISRLEFEELAVMRPREREEFIASSKNRFLGFLENPIVELALGRAEGVLDAHSLIQDGAIVIINLERRGVLRDEDVEIFANLWLNELFHAVLNTPETARKKFFVFLDELPTFSACAPQLTFALTQIRKFKLRLVCAHQGTQFFPDRTEDRLLNALVGQCGMHLYFRHVNPADAKYFAGIMSLPSLDPWRVKHELRQTQQYQDGHDLVTLMDYGTNWSKGEQEGTADAVGTSDSTTETDGSSNSRTVTDTRGSSGGTSATDTHTSGESRLEETVSRARGESQGTNASTAHSDMTGSSTSTARARGSSTTHTTNWATTTSRGGNKTWKQTLVPRMRWREIVTSIQFLSTDEQIIQVASGQASLPTGHAALYISGKGVSLVKLPLAKNPFLRMPKFCGKKIRELLLDLTRRPEFQSATFIVEYRQNFHAALLKHLQSAGCVDVGDETNDENFDPQGPWTI